MKTQIFAVYDKKAMMYLKPFPALNNSVALRMFSDIVIDPNTQFFRHGEDFDLYHIAYFDDNSGQFENVKNPIPLGKATDFQQQYEQLKKVKEEVQKNGQTADKKSDKKTAQR